MSDDLKLLKEYAETRNADAFAELARRHSGLVYGACLRVIGNEHDAEDVSQECFLELARNAGSVEKSLLGWLHFVATRRSKNAIRGAAARRRHEELAMAKSQQSSEPAWAEVAPHIDDAIEQLPDDLRLPVLLHYLEGRSQAEVAEELSVDQSTVSRRIEKGIGRLREHLKKAGFVVSAGVLAALLSESAATAAPAVVTAAIGKIAVAGVGQAWSTAAATAVMSVKVKVLLGAALAVAAAGAVVVVKNSDPKADPEAGVAQVAEVVEVAQVDFPTGTKVVDRTSQVNRWPIAANHGARLVDGWLSFDETDGELAVREHVGGGSRNPLDEPLELALKTQAKGGLLHLQMIQQWDDRRASVGCKTSSPKGTTMRTEKPMPFSGLTTEYQVLWRVDFVKAGEIVKSVAYVARLSPIAEQYFGFGRQELPKVKAALRKSEGLNANNSGVVSLQNAIKDILPQNWVMHAPFEGEVSPTNLATSRGMEIKLQRKGYKPVDWKYGRGGEIHIWLMPQQYKPGMPPPPEAAQVAPAHEIKQWQDRRVFIWGSGGKDWPKWQEDIKSVLDKTSASL